jgi:hypothetical protein
MRWFLQKWDFFSAALLAVVGAYFLPHNAMKDITTELIAFFSIQSAVILPAMIFTAGILKPDGLELEDATRYHKALKAQMLFWVALLSLDFVAVVSPQHFKPFDLGWLLPAILYFSGSLAVFRTVPFVRGVLSLLDVNSDMTLKAITRRNRIENVERRAKADPRPMALPEGYGKIVTPEDE